MSLENKLLPQISIVIPAYNAHATLATCLEALRNQTLDQALYEIIVVDDGSTDDTAAIAAAGKVMVIRQKNQGPAAARNAGAAKAAGEIVLFTDSDCIPDSAWVEKMTEPFQDSSVAAVKGVYKASSDSKISRLAQVEFEERYRKMKRSPSVDFVDTYAMGVRKQVFLELGGFDTSFPSANNEDVDFSYRLAGKGMTIVFRPDAFVRHRHADSFTDYLRTKFWRGYWRMVVYSGYRSKMFKDSYTPQTLKIQIVLAWLLVGLLSLSVALPGSQTGIVLVVFLLFMVSTVPFLSVLIREEMPLLPLSPGFLLGRALSLGGGVLYFLLKGDMRGKRLPRQTPSIG